MKSKTIVKCPAEDLFNVVAYQFVYDYNKSKKSNLTVKDLYKGMTYNKMSNLTGRKNIDNIATVKLLDFEYPIKYRFSYLSQTHYKLIGFEITPLTDITCEVIFEEYNEPLSSDTKPRYPYYNGDNEKIKKPTLSRRLMFRNTAKSIMKERAKNNNQLAK